MLSLLRTPLSEMPMDTQLIDYYEAIERASNDMLQAARQGNWSEVVRIEGACALLISKLRHASQGTALDADQVRRKSTIMQRILVNDAEIRHLVEPWLEDIDTLLSGQRQRTLH